MLTEQGCRQRRQRLWDKLHQDISWVLVADPRHIQYLANFWVQPLSFSFSERALLLLKRSGEAILLADNFTRRSAATEPHVDREIIETWYDHEHSIINRDHARTNALRQITKEVASQRGLVESEWLSLGAAEALGLQRFEASGVDLGSLLRRLRREKQEDEIELMRACMKATEAGHARAREVIAPGISDLEVFREIQSATIAAAGRPAIIYGDFRQNSAVAPKAGGLPVNEPLVEGNLFIVDYSVILDGYRSDFTNTYAIGAPNEAQQKLFDTCVKAMERGAEVLKPGIEGSSVYDSVSTVLEEAGYGKLSHHAGHGLGMAHPELPILVPESRDKLKAGDVVTLEPGAYIEGTGGVRVENNYLITESGCEQLSHHEVRL